MLCGGIGTAQHALVGQTKNAEGITLSVMSKKSIKKNYLYNVLYELLLLLTPLITTPYLSRVLGADGVGTVSYAESIVSYFTLVATLGMTTFGRREISYVQDNKKERTRVFWETNILEFITTFIVLMVYLPFALHQNNHVMYLILSLNLFAVMANITWFFQGIEEFGKIVFRNIVFKVINIVYIFIKVKTKEDINFYVFGMAFFLFLSNVSLWLYLPKYIEKPELKNLHPFKNVRTVLSLFLPTIAIQVYTVLDKTMIGVITRNAFENGYYEQAIKISKMALTVVTSLGTVMIPRIGYHYAKGEFDKVEAFMYRAYRFVWFMGIPLCFGLIGVASNFVPWFYGSGFEKVIPLLNVLSFLILAIGINNVTGIQYFIPTKRQNLFTFTVVIGACVNFGLNYILIRYYQSIGAAIASVTAETVIALVQLYIVRNELSPIKIFTSSGHYLIAGMAMLVSLKYLGIILSPSIAHTFIMIISGALLYMGTLLIMRDSFLISNASNILKKARRRR